MTTQYTETLWADHLRGFATLAVIILHISAAPVLYPYAEITSANWWTGNIYDGAVRFCVPVFLMLSGALILPKIYTLQTFLKKRFSRIMLPFLFWSLLYIAYDIYLKWENNEYLNATEISTFTFRQLKSGASSHLWYIYMLIGIYLVFPVISKWIAHSTHKEIWYYIIVWIFGILCGLSLLHEIKTNISLVYFSGFLGYPILGYLLASFKPSKKIKQYALLIFVVGTLITIFGTYFQTEQDKQFYDGLYSYLSPNVILASSGIFLLFRHSHFQNPALIRAAKVISKYSYGIYLSHVLFISLLGRLGILWNMINPVLGIPLTAFFCLTISLLVTILISKIPFGKYISG